MRNDLAAWLDHPLRTALGDYYPPDLQAAPIYDELAADEAAFAPYDPPTASVEEAWELVDDQRAQFVEESSVWRRYASWLSLRSFTRHVHPVESLRRLNTRLTFESKEIGRAHV
mgnify:CR=1 FL=1